MTSLLCIHFICFEQHTHKNLAAFARLKAVHLYKTFLHTGQSCQFARFRKFFKFIINFYKQPALWIIIVLLALSIKVSTNNLCNWLISYILSLNILIVSGVLLYHYHRRSDLQHIFCLLSV